MSNEFEVDQNGVHWYIENGKRETGIKPDEVSALDFFRPDWRDLPRAEVVKILTTTEKQKAKPSPLVFSWEIDLDAETPALVERCFPAVGVGCMYAQPGIGKSAVAIDLSYRIASGAAEWAHQSINLHGDVVYVAMEGGESLKSFIRGWRREHPADYDGARVAFYFASETDQELQPLVQRMDPRDGHFYEVGILQLDEWIKGKDLTPRLIVLDTQVDMMDPDSSENDSAPSAQMYRAAGRLAERLGCFVLFLHHAVKTANRTDKPTYRGSSAFAAKADVMAYLQGVSSGRGNGKLVFEKRKPFGGDDPKVNYQGVRDDIGDDLCVSWGSPNLAELADTPEAEAEERRARTRVAIWETLHEATKAVVDADTGATVDAPVPFSGTGVVNAMKELATREDDRLDVLFGSNVIRDLLVEMNEAGQIVNVADSVGQGKSAAWVAGRRPSPGGED
ncbi:AAA family ATPase [Nocardioides antri]|uniref:AAA family ATPase n=1 Tax=Nocardioides antri TaxID=2607659 RepID=A0A5B1LV89_9ACTN|nr:AAA family ATPase [Nocardioides antri]KAA1424324.1 AAA family ATPase [Nocardioides antri]